jgi:hypothetical protein
VPRKPISVEAEYTLADDTVRLTVMVGDRQYGSSMVFLGDELLANGDIDEIPLGNGADLEGKMLSVYTVVTDVRDRKAEMSVTWILTGGKKRLKLEETGAAPKSFGSQMFKAVFDLVADS